MRLSRIRPRRQRLAANPPCPAAPRSLASRYARRCFRRCPARPRRRPDRRRRISGIGAAYRLKKRCPGKSCLILEARDAIGGTWDLFRYPGIRSDSDMYTLGFPFRPWRGDKAIVDGASIRAYVEETARAYGIDGRSASATRRVGADLVVGRGALDGRGRSGGGVAALHLRLPVPRQRLLRLRRGLPARMAGRDRISRPIVHPQFWPEDLDCRGKRVVVIGSGATAVTLAPALAEQGAQVTMLQRSPSYVVARPARDRSRLAQRISGRPRPSDRWKNVLLGAFFFIARRASRTGSRRDPASMVAEALPRRLRRRPPFQARLQSVGPAPLPRPRRRPVHGDRRGRGRVVDRPIARFTGRDRAGDRRRAEGRHRRHRDRPRGEAARRAWRSPSTASRSTSPTPQLQGHDAERRAEPRRHLRLHQRLLDAEQRPYCAQGLPPAQPDGQARAAASRARAPATALERRPMLDFSSGYVQRAPRAAAEPGHEPALARPPELSRAT